MIDTPLKRPLESLVRGCSSAGARIAEIISRLQVTPDLEEESDALLYMVAEGDPATAAFLRLEGLRPQPRWRSDREIWTS